MGADPFFLFPLMHWHWHCRWEGGARPLSFNSDFPTKRAKHVGRVDHLKRRREERGGRCSDFPSRSQLGGRREDRRKECATNEYGPKVHFSCGFGLYLLCKTMIFYRDIICWIAPSQFSKHSEVSHSLALIMTFM